MPWSDDTRCLYCDGKLPLYRKLTQGQFCSRPHQDAYWKEQDNLAVESLHKTHDALRAYRPAESIESILGPAPLEPTRGLTAAQPTWAVPELQSFPAVPSQPAAPPPMARLLSQNYATRAAWSGLPGMISADPLEYEITIRPALPLAFTAVSADVSNTLAALAQLRQVDPLEFERVPVTGSLAVLDCSLAPTVPESTKASVSGLAMSGKVDLLASSSATSEPVHADPQPLTVSMHPLYHMDLALVPVGDVIDRVELDQFAMVDTLLPLPTIHAASAAKRFRVEPEFSESSFNARKPSLLSVHGAEPFLPESSTLQELEMGRPRDCSPTPHGEAEAMEPSCHAVTNLPMQAAAVPEPVWADLVALPEVLHSRDANNGAAALPVEFHAFALLAPCNPISIAAAAAHAPVWVNPVLANLVALTESLHSQAAPNHAADRPVAFQALPVSSNPLLPQRAGDETAPQMKSRPQKLFRLNLSQMLAPRNCATKLRTASLVALTEPEKPILPPLRLEPIAPQTGATSLSGSAHFGASIPAKVRGMAAGAAGFWNHAPRDLKVLLFAVPIALALAFHPSLPKVSMSAPQSGPQISSRFKQVVDTQFASLKKSMAKRAAVGLDEDFRQGLDNWTSRSGNVAEWSFDQLGSVLPGKVALYAPSLKLTDYEMQFLGMIDNGALSWVIRASDFDNYYVVKLMVVKPGPVPQLGLTRYAVVNGKAQDRVDTPVILSTRMESGYRILMNVKGGNYSLNIQGQVIDAWTETRLKHGGVGFFTTGGEKSRVRWMQITHQYDMLGRLFAYLAPYEIPTSSGGW